MISVTHIQSFNKSFICNRHRVILRVFKVEKSIQNIYMSVLPQHWPPIKQRELRKEYLQFINFFLCIYVWPVSDSQEESLRTTHWWDFHIKNRISDDKSPENEMSGKFIECSIRWKDYARVSLPYMWRTNTEKMKRTLITRTGTGPTLNPGESSV